MTAPAPERAWRQGPYRAIAATRMRERLRLAPGDVMRHEHGLILTTCPVCDSTVMGLGRLLEGGDAPTVDRPLHCGATCRRCDTWFQIAHGRAIPAAPPPPAPNRITEKLAAAGVRPPPRLAPRG